MLGVLRIHYILHYNLQSDCAMFCIYCVLVVHKVATENDDD